MARYNLADVAWCAIQPVLPKKSCCHPRVDDRRVLNGIFWVLLSGAPWVDLPERYGPVTTCYNRFRRWTKAGVWDQIITAISDASGRDIKMIDGTSDRVHHAAATLKKPPVSLSRTKPGRSYNENPCCSRRSRLARRLGDLSRPSA
jgi:transposase